MIIKKAIFLIYSLLILIQPLFAQKRFITIGDSVLKSITEIDNIENYFTFSKNSYYSKRSKNGENKYRHYKFFKNNKSDITYLRFDYLLEVPEFEYKESIFLEYDYYNDTILSNNLYLIPSVKKGLYLDKDSAIAILNSQGLIKSDTYEGYFSHYFNNEFAWQFFVTIKSLRTKENPYNDRIVDIITVNAKSGKIEKIEKDVELHKRGIISP